MTTKNHLLFSSHKFAPIFNQGSSGNSVGFDVSRLCVGLDS